MLSPFALFSLIKNMFFRFVCIADFMLFTNIQQSFKSPSFDTQKVESTVEHILPDNEPSKTRLKSHNWLFKRVLGGSLSGNMQRRTTVSVRASRLCDITFFYDLTYLRELRQFESCLGSFKTNQPFKIKNHGTLKGLNWMTLLSFETTFHPHSGSAQPHSLQSTECASTSAVVLLRCCFNVQMQTKCIKTIASVENTLAFVSLKKYTRPWRARSIVSL